LTSTNSGEKNDKKVVKPLTSVHVVHYVCSNCGEEEEQAKLCSSCKAPSRIIKVTELYGDEANDYLEKIKAGVAQGSAGIQSEQYDDSIPGVGGEEADGGGDTMSDVQLGDIFPDDDSSEKTYVDNLGDDFESALDILDQEDDEEDIEELPEL